MIKFSKLADYAVVVMACLASQGGQRITTSQISDAIKIPEPTVAKVLKLLSRDNLITSTRGASGGYVLEADPADISVYRIVVCVDGPVSLTACVDGIEISCNYKSCCPIKGRWDPVNLAVKNALENVFLSEMIEPEYQNIQTPDKEYYKEERV